MVHFILIIYYITDYCSIYISRVVVSYRKPIFDFDIQTKNLGTGIYKYTHTALPTDIEMLHYTVHIMQSLIAFRYFHS